jgi:hypothetical protein
MMGSRHIAVLSTLFLVAASTGRALRAQASQCAALDDDGRRTCVAAVDFARAYYPLAGLAVSGGNPVLGDGGTAGGFGHFDVTLRANGFTLHVPDLGAIGADGTVAEDQSLLAPAPLIEARVGLFGGLPGGFLGIDLLGAAQLVPNEDLTEDIRVDSTAPRIGPVSLGIGLGARVGLMAERAGRPALAVSVMRRSIPRVGFGDVVNGDEVQADVDLVAWNVRGTIGKHVGPLLLAGGGGWSRYTGNATAEYNGGPGPGQQGSIDLDLRQTRWMAFVNAGVGFSVVRLVAEAGYQFGVDQQLGTTFEGFDDTAGTLYYSAGLQFGI